MTIYTLGYSGWKLDDIRSTVDRLDAVLVDVRMVPRSRVPHWSAYSLSRKFGPRCAWVRELANKNYKGTFEQIEIANFPEGLKRLQEILTGGSLSEVEGPAGEPAARPTGGRNIILLCGCADVNQCHRKVLADWLAQAWSADVVHLAPPAKNAQPGQQTLF